MGTRDAVQGLRCGGSQGRLVLKRNNYTLTQRMGSALVPLLASQGSWEPKPDQGPVGLLRSFYRKPPLTTGLTDPNSPETLTYLKDSTMAVTIPVTIITIPRTQKRPVHEVKSTCQEGGMKFLPDWPCLPPPPGSPSAARG